MTVQDDAGEPVRRLGADEIRELRQGDRTSMLGARLEAVLEYETHRLLTPTNVAAGCIWLLVAAAAVYFWNSIVVGGWRQLLGVVLLSFVPTIVIKFIGRQIGRSSSMAGTAIAEGICGGCGYVLDGIPSEGGRVKCPECSAVWRASRITKPVWEIPSPWPMPNRLRGIRRLLTLQPRAKFWMVLDANDRATRAVDPRLCFASPLAPGAHGVSAWRELSRAVGRTGRWVRWSVTGALFASAAMLIAFVMNPSSGSGWTTGAVIGIVTLVVAGFAVQFSHAFRSPSGTARRAVRFGACGSCAMPLDEPSGDHPVVCDTCGCAWLRG